MSFQMDKIASWAVVWRPWLTPNAWVSSASTDSNYHSDKSASQRFMRSKHPITSHCAQLRSHQLFDPRHVSHIILSKLWRHSALWRPVHAKTLLRAVDSFSLSQRNRNLLNQPFCKS